MGKKLKKYDTKNRPVGQAKIVLPGQASWRQKASSGAFALKVHLRIALLALFFCFAACPSANAQTDLNAVRDQSWDFVKKTLGQPAMDLNDSIKSMGATIDTYPANAEDKVALLSIFSEACCFRAMLDLATYAMFATAAEAGIASANGQDLSYYADTLARFPGAIAGTTQRIKKFSDMIQTPQLKEQAQRVLALIDGMTKYFDDWPGAELRKAMKAKASGKGDLPQCLIAQSATTDNLIDSIQSYQDFLNQLISQYVKKQGYPAPLLIQLRMNTSLIAIECVSQFLLATMKYRLSSTRNNNQFYSKDIAYLESQLKHSMRFIEVWRKSTSDYSADTLGELKMKTEEIIAKTLLFTTSYASCISSLQ